MARSFKMQRLKATSPSSKPFAISLKKMQSNLDRIKYKAPVNLTALPLMQSKK